MRATRRSSTSPKKPCAPRSPRDLYAIRHGLEIYDPHARQTRALKPGEERLADRATIEEAVEAVVGPLADGLSGVD